MQVLSTSTDHTNRSHTEPPKAIHKDHVGLYRLAMKNLSALNSPKNQQRGIELLKRSANLGCLCATRELMYRYQQGKGVAKDESAFYQLLLCIDEASRNMDESYNVAVMYEHGKSGTINLSLAVKNYERAAALGCDQAKEILVELYLDEKSKFKNFERAEKYLQQLATPKAFHLLAKSILAGNIKAHEGLNPIELLKKSAVLGYIYAKRELIWRYDHGDGVRKNARKSFEWLVSIEESSRSKDDWYNLALDYHYGQGVDIDLATALQSYEKAANLGCQESKEIVADFYLEGKGVEIDLNKGEKYLRELDPPQSLYKLGCAVLDGQIVPKDGVGGIELLKRSAKLGSIKAKRELSICYQCGDFVEKNRDSEFQYLVAIPVQSREARDWYQLGIFYEVDKDSTHLKKARRCFMQAAKLGCQESKKILAIYGVHGKWIKQDENEGFLTNLNTAEAFYHLSIATEVKLIPERNGVSAKDLRKRGDELRDQEFYTLLNESKALTKK